MERYMEKKAEFVITDGSVEYRRMKPLGEYNTKQPTVRLNFQVAEGSDPLIVTTKVMNMAIGVVESAITGVVPTEEKPYHGLAKPGTVGRQRAERPTTAATAPSETAPPNSGDASVSDDDVQPST